MEVVLEVDRMGSAMEFKRAQILQHIIRGTLGIMKKP